MHREHLSASAALVLTIPLLLCLPHTLVAAFSVYDYIPSSFGSPGTRSGGSLVRRDELSEYGFYNPLDYGGYMMTYIPTEYTVGLGEPVNAILSAKSDPQILIDQETNGGLRNYFLSFQFGAECLGQHEGSHQIIDLGDGNGPKNETAVIRYDYGDPSLGTCQETIQGGNHFRYWVQNGPQRNSSAVFMAVSYEHTLQQNHLVILNGYNLGRDWAVGNATNQSQPINTSTVTNGSTFQGQTTFNGYTYSTTVRYMSGILQNTSNGVNHAGDVAPPGGNAIDGLVSVFEAHIVGKPTSGKSASAGHPVTWSWAVSTLAVTLLLTLLL
ncbi:hypothetical protein BJ322DRAFT_145059 [Thelephora terrestris]|uniref:Uncharacterized protein n=1 Tax=Thelephora terrestris TaxID=56493 RepID=A0A9P6L5M6_9AGAM|nr:hypothetical protein BJ322DRAFT_145059 [Thelephora terrestris]